MSFGRINADQSAYSLGSRKTHCLQLPPGGERDCNSFQTVQNTEANRQIG
jgi:hypothetical protein